MSGHTRNTSTTQRLSQTSSVTEVFCESGAQINPAEVRTHSSLIGAFGKHLVKPGLASTELGRALNQVERIRLLADYTGEVIDTDKAVWAIDQADAFLKTLVFAIRE
jgi:uncharacterized protein (UPF0332 family)